MIQPKTESELDKMRRAARILSGLLREAALKVIPGIKTIHLDTWAEAYIRDNKALPAFKGYYGFPSTLCISVNDEVVHGIPGERVLKQGDIVGVDVGAVVEGYYADAARTFAVGEVDSESVRLIKVTREALNKGIEKAVEGNRLSDISCAVQTHAEANGLSVVREYVGHGIGQKLHEEPQVPNYGKAGMGPVLKAGMTLAIEPMLNIGTHQVKVLSDNWTVVTMDGKRSCHFEDTIIVGKSKAEIITRG